MVISLLLCVINMSVLVDSWDIWEVIRYFGFEKRGEIGWLGVMEAAGISSGEFNLFRLEVFVVELYAFW